MPHDRFDPDTDPQTIPPARHIYGNSKREGKDNHMINDYDTIEQDTIQFLKRHGTEFGTPLACVAKALEIHNIKLMKTCDNSDEIEVLHISNKTRIRLDEKSL